MQLQVLSVRACCVLWGHAVRAWFPVSWISFRGSPVEWEVLCSAVQSVTHQRHAGARRRVVCMCFRDVQGTGTDWLLRGKEECVCC